MSLERRIEALVREPAVKTAQTRRRTVQPTISPFRASRETCASETSGSAATPSAPTRCLPTREEFRARNAQRSVRAGTAGLLALAVGLLLAALGLSYPTWAIFYVLALVFGVAGIAAAAVALRAARRAARCAAWAHRLGRRLPRLADRAGAHRLEVRVVRAGLVVRSRRHRVLSAVVRARRWRPDRGSAFPASGRRFPRSCVPSVTVTVFPEPPSSRA